ncbi:MAG: hypothetical protein ACE15B_06775 [Bryobacteraceae bacterium]
MRFLLCGVVFACALAAQRLPVERFDVSGLPRSPQTDTERELQRMISGHRAGDAAHAAEIQRKLAAYYRAKGDQNRARSAEALAGGARMPGAPGMGAMDYGQGYDMTTMPAYGIPAARPQPREKEKAPLAAPLPGEAPKEDTGLPKVSVYPGATPGEEKKEQPAPPPAAQSSQVWDSKPETSQSDFAGRFYALQGGMLHTWDFRPDGTFEHFWAPRGAQTPAANFEAGKYVVSGNFVNLIILRGGRGGQRRAGFQRGANGITLDGVVMTPAMP